MQKATDELLALLEQAQGKKWLHKKGGMVSWDVWEI